MCGNLCYPWTKEWDELRFCNVTILTVCVNGVSGWHTAKQEGVWLCGRGPMIKLWVSRLKFSGLFRSSPAGGWRGNNTIRKLSLGSWPEPGGCDLSFYLMYRWCWSVDKSLLHRHRFWTWFWSWQGSERSCTHTQDMKNKLTANCCWVNSNNLWPNISMHCFLTWSVFV